MGLNERWVEMVEAAAKAELEAACRTPLIRTPISAEGLFKPITRAVDAETGEVYDIRQAGPMGCGGADGARTRTGLDGKPAGRPLLQPLVCDSADEAKKITDGGEA